MEYVQRSTYTNIMGAELYLLLRYILLCQQPQLWPAQRLHSFGHHQRHQRDLDLPRTLRHRQIRPPLRPLDGCSWHGNLAIHRRSLRSSHKPRQPSVNCRAICFHQYLHLLLCLDLRSRSLGRDGRDLSSESKSEVHQHDGTYSNPYHPSHMSQTT